MIDSLGLLAIGWASNDITSSRWQGPYPRYFVYTFVQWEVVETHGPSFYRVCGLYPFRSAHVQLPAETKCLII